MAALSLLAEKNVLESYLLTLLPVGSFPLFPAGSHSPSSGPGWLEEHSEVMNLPGTLPHLILCLTTAGPNQSPFGLLHSPPLQ